MNKEENPKDIIASGKLPLGVVPDTVMIETAIAFLEGALKYGTYNWRLHGVKASVYHDALKRHLADWWNGEDADPITKVKNLSSVIACAGIILDAEVCGMLTDDRPPRAPISELIEKYEEQVKFLKDMFKDYNPHQYTINDTK